MVGIETCRLTPILGLRFPLRFPVFRPSASERPRRSVHSTNPLLRRRSAIPGCRAFTCVFTGSSTPLSCSREAQPPQRRSCRPLALLVGRPQTLANLLSPQATPHVRPPLANALARRSESSHCAKPAALNRHCPPTFPRTCPLRAVGRLGRNRCLRPFASPAVSAS